MVCAEPERRGGAAPTNAQRTARRATGAEARGHSQRRVWRWCRVAGPDRRYSARMARNVDPLNTASRPLRGKRVRPVEVGGDSEQLRDAWISSYCNSYERQFDGAVARDHLSHNMAM